MRRILGKVGIVNKGEVQLQFAANNLAVVGWIGLFYSFARKLSVEEALERGTSFQKGSQV